MKTHEEDNSYLLAEYKDIIAESDTIKKVSYYPTCLSFSSVCCLRRLRLERCLCGADDESGLIELE